MASAYEARSKESADESLFVLQSASGAACAGGYQAAAGAGGLGSTAAHTLTRVACCGTACLLPLYVVVQGILSHTHAVPPADALHM